MFDKLLGLTWDFQRHDKGVLGDPRYLSTGEKDQFGSDKEDMQDASDQ